MGPLLNQCSYVLVTPAAAGVVRFHELQVVAEKFLNRTMIVNACATLPLHADYSLLLSDYLRRSLESARLHSAGADMTIACAACGRRTANGERRMAAGQALNCL